MRPLGGIFPTRGCTSKSDSAGKESFLEVAKWRFYYNTDRWQKRNRICFEFHFHPEHLLWQARIRLTNVLPRLIFRNGRQSRARRGRLSPTHHAQNRLTVVTHSSVNADTDWTRSNGYSLRQIHLVEKRFNLYDHFKYKCNEKKTIGKWNHRA